MFLSRVFIGVVLVVGILAYQEDASSDSRPFPLS